MKLDYKTMEGLWGEDEPYSQVQLLKQTRILGADVVRNMIYVYANINPTTFEVLKKSEDKIKDDLILDFINDAQYVSMKDGFEWYLYSQETNDSTEAEKIAKKMKKTVIKMHKMVIEFLELKPEEKTDLLISMIDSMEKKSRK